ncbi:hypothetical protein GALL_420940 [mine drainage metagenome]|uniref:Uncharacterized protein n=1 Tax=mine drainage metagenome TaxID=410659 RepID=A0A1J5Q898_9ZZZZ
MREQIKLKPLPHAFYPLAARFARLRLLERVTITPDDYYDLSRSGCLQCVWEDRFSKTLP